MNDRRTINRAERPLSIEEAAANYRTLQHITRVAHYLNVVTQNLQTRGENHDNSKLHDPEVSVFAEFTPMLGKIVYGSDEYKATVALMKPALDHHYANNTHHPEHHPNGIRGMTLLDLIEMICDWKASSERTRDSNIRKSLEINKTRFNISDDLIQILINTVDELQF